MQHGGVEAECLLVVNFKWERKMKNFLMRLWKEEEGQDLVEYALLIVIVALTVFAVAPGITTAIEGVFSRASTCLNGGACVANAP